MQTRNDIQKALELKLKHRAGHDNDFYSEASVEDVDTMGDDNAPVIGNLFTKKPKRSNSVLIGSTGSKPFDPTRSTITRMFTGAKDKIIAPVEKKADRVPYWHFNSNFDSTDR